MDSLKWVLKKTKLMYMSASCRILAWGFKLFLILMIVDIHTLQYDLSETFKFIFKLSTHNLLNLSADHRSKKKKKGTSDKIPDC